MSVDLAHHEIVRAKDGKGGINPVQFIRTYETRMKRTGLTTLCLRRWLMIFSSLSSFLCIFVCAVVSLPHGTMGYSVICDCEFPGPQDYKTLFMLNRIEHEIYHAHKC